MDRCGMCREWSCSSHPTDERKPCPAQREAGAAPHNQTTLEAAWGLLPEAQQERKEPDTNDADSLGSMLQALASEPAPRTLVWVPRSMEGRVADIAIACFATAAPHMTL